MQSCITPWLAACGRQNPWRTCMYTVHACAYTTVSPSERSTKRYRYMAPCKTEVYGSHKNVTSRIFI